MIKKLIGLLAAAGIIAVLAFVILHRSNYRSMLFDEEMTLLDVFGGSKSDPVPDAASGPVFDSPDDLVPDADFVPDAGSIEEADTTEWTADSDLSEQEIEPEPLPDTY